MTTTEVPQTIQTTDQNTARTITWNVDYSTETGPNVHQNGGWTHMLAVSRPKGRRSYVIHVILEAGQVVKATRPVVAF